MEIIVWLILFILFVVIEIITVGLVTIWFAGGALVAIILALVDASVEVQIIVFAFISFTLLYFTRPVAMKKFNRARYKTNIDSIIGQTAIVTEEISNIQGVGKVVVNGQEWSARALEDDMVIIAGDVAEIVKIEGVKLIVKR